MRLLKLYKTGIRYFIIFSIFFFNSCKTHVLTSIDNISPNNSQHFQTPSKDIQRNLQGNTIKKIKRDNSLNVDQKDLCDVEKYWR